MKRLQLNIRLDEIDLERMKKLCEIHGVSKTVLIKEMLRKELFRVKKDA